MKTTKPASILGVLIAAGAAAYAAWNQQKRPDSPEPKTQSQTAPASIKPPTGTPRPTAASPAKGEQAGKPAASESSYGWPAPKPRTPGTIRLATYNLENLFDDKDDPALSGKFDDKSMTKPAAACEALAKTIRAIDADVIACEEVESLEALTWFRDTYLKGAGYDHIASIQSGDPRGIEQGVLSKIPFKKAELLIPVDQLQLEGVHPASLPPEDKDKVGKPIVMSRSPLKVEFALPPDFIAKLVDSKGKPGVKPAEYDFTLVIVHHKSAREYAYQREAEAKRVLKVVKEMEQKSPAINICVLGDFNSLPQHEGPQVYFTGGMIDLFSDRTRNDPRYITHATGRSIDYILVNKNMKPEVVMESRFILGTPQRPKGSDWDTTPAPAGYASDHMPVVVDITPVDGK